MAVNNNAFGFTLIELMIAVAVLGVVATLAVPNFAAAIKRHQLTSHVDNYFFAIRYARAEAIRTSSEIEVLPIANEDWKSGIVVKFVDDASGDEGEVLRLVAGNEAIEVTSSLEEQQLRFNGKGYLSDGLSLSFCEAGLGSYSRKIEVLTSGFAAIKQGECL